MHSVDYHKVVIMALAYFDFMTNESRETLQQLDENDIGRDYAQARFETYDDARRLLRNLNSVLLLKDTPEYYVDG